MRSTGLIVAALCSSGCSLALMAVAPPKKQVVRQVTRSQSVAIRTVPSDGTVSHGQGPPRTAPTELEASYQVQLVHRERSEIYPIIGIGTGAATLITGAGVMLGSAGRDGPTSLGGALVLLGIVDLLSMPNRYLSFRRRNERAALSAREIPIPRPLELEVRWPNSPPQTARLDWPKQRFVTIPRVRPPVYDEALIAWAETKERTPSAEGLFNLGAAYAARASAHKDVEDTRKALDYFERYLKTENVSEARRARVEELSRPLRGAR